MMKSATTILMVDSIPEAVKYYTEKLAFDISDMGMCPSKEEAAGLPTYAELRKGKCHLLLIVPTTEELVEFSQIKHCASRGVCVYAEMKKGVEKYFNRCKSKGVRIVEELGDKPWGDKTFTIKDPFGFKFTFAQPIEGFQKPSPLAFCGLEIDKNKPEATLLEEMIDHLLGFGLSRRASRKYAKVWVKDLKKG